MTHAIGEDGIEFEFGDSDPDDAYSAGDDEFVTFSGPLTASVNKNLWLHNFPKEAALRGLKIETYPGWDTRSRSSGGFDDILGVCLHHTASNTRPENDMAYQWKNADTRPIGNFSLHRDGTIVLGAAGASNTQGKGGPYRCSKGTVPLDAGNRYLIAIEACNNGVGERWPEVQIKAYERLIEVLLDVYGLVADPDVLLHATWAPGRKTDPAGPTPSEPTWGGTSGRNIWDLHAVRTSVAKLAPPIDMSNPPTITNPVRIVDTRTGTTHNPHKGSLASGESLRVFPHSYTSKDAKGVVLSLTGLGETYGYFTLWDGAGSPPASSNLNMTPGTNPNNMAWVPLTADGAFKVYSGGAGAKNGIIIDQVGWYF